MAPGNVVLRSGVRPGWGSGQPPHGCVSATVSARRAASRAGCPSRGPHAHGPAPQEKNARLLGAVQQLFGHCQAQKEEIKRLFQQKLDEVGALPWPP